MTKNLLKTLSFLFLLFIINGCTKEGPAGPQGATGAQGAQGQPGPSAKYYDFTLPFSSSIKSGNYSFGGIMSNDEVGILYVTTITDNNVPLSFRATVPYKEFISTNLSASQGAYFDLTYNLASTTVFVYNATTPPYSVLYFRLVIITPTKGAQKKQDVDYNNYDEVKKYYNLPS